MARQLLSGRRNRRVAIQAGTRTQDASGGESVTWATSFEAYAAIEPLRGREYLDAQAVGSDVTHKATMPYTAGVTPAHRLLMSDGRIFDIKSVLNIDERDRQLQLMVVERAD